MHTKKGMHTKMVLVTIYDLFILSLFTLNFSYASKCGSSDPRKIIIVQDMALEDIKFLQAATYRLFEWYLLGSDIGWFLNTCSLRTDQGKRNLFISLHIPAIKLQHSPGCQATWDIDTMLCQRDPPLLPVLLGSSVMWAIPTIKTSHSSLLGDQVPTRISKHFARLQ